jgi:capsular exopolysaccharide synthesis family protein
MEHLNSSQSIAVVTNQTAPNQLQRAYNPYGLESSDNNGSDASLIEYWLIIQRNKKTILITSILGLLAGYAIGIPMKPIFRATTTIEVLSINEDFMNMKQANPTTTSDGNYDTSEEQTQAKLLESTSLLNRVVGKLDAGSGTLPTPSQGSSWWERLFKTEATAEVSDRRKLLNQAVSSLKVHPTARTRILEVTVDSTNPKLASDFANTLTKEFINQNLEARWATTQRTSEWLRRELDDARDKLRQSEDNLQNYARNSGLIFTDETTNVATEKLQQLQQNLSAATADRITKQSRYELAQNAPPESLADVLSDHSLSEIQSKMSDLKRQLADLRTVFSPEFSKVRRLQAELETLQPVFANKQADIVLRIKNDFTEASRREKLLEMAYNSQAHEVTGQDEKAIQYNILKRDVDSNRQLYDTMLQQMKQASIASAIRASNVRVVDPAEVPQTSFSPNFKLNSAVGLLAGLLLSLTVVTLRERADRTLHQPGDIRLWADLPELGTIPTSSIDAKRPPYYRPIISPESGRQATVTFRAEGDNKPVELITLQNKPSLIAEAFRSALTSIIFVGENGSRPKVLVFTSANAADGKTTVVSNIAIAAAEIRMRVLVIDADLRRPRIHQVFDLNNDRGLTDLLQQNSEQLSLNGLIKPTSVEGLHIITAGPATHAAAHLLYSPNFAATIAKLRPEYDMILIDTPPVLQITDSRVAGRLADAVVLVARSNRTTRDAVLAVKGRFSEDRIRVLGAVLNDWNPKRASSGYYSYYQSNSPYSPTN